jgi:hypothetical protein
VRSRFLARAVLENKNDSTDSSRFPVHRCATWFANALSKMRLRIMTAAPFRLAALFR